MLSFESMKADEKKCNFFDNFLLNNSPSYYFVYNAKTIPLSLITKF